MKRNSLRIVAILLAFVIVFAPVTAFAAHVNEIPLVQRLAAQESGSAQEPSAYEDLRIIELTTAARDIVLKDFDYLVNKILAVAPTQNIFYRRFGITLEYYFELYRQFIYDMNPIPSLLSYYNPVRWGEPPEGDLYIAADYLFTILDIISWELGGLGHLLVQHGEGVEHTAFGLAYTVNHDSVELTEDEWDELLEFGYTREDIQRSFDASLRFIELRYAIYNTPSVLWFYGINPAEFDFDVDISEVIGYRDYYNVTTFSLEPGAIAYVHIASFMNNIVLDSETLFPFFEEIQDYEHLIIDLRGNAGGWVSSFPTNVLSMLIDEKISFWHYEFFIASELTADFFENPTSMTNGLLYGIFPIAEFVEDRNMTHFNPQDLELLDYVMVWTVDHFPAYDNIPFQGEIWLLVDDMSMSASELAAIISISTGFATVVGEPTGGVTGVLYTYAALPNTGILFRIDLGYTVDGYGRSIEEFGVIPQVFNFPGMDALDTVLTIILEDYFLDMLMDFLQELEVYSLPQAGALLPPPPPPAFPIGSSHIVVDGVDFISLRFAAHAHGYSVSWDGVYNSVIVHGPGLEGSTRVVPVSANGVFNKEGTVFVPVELAVELFSSDGALRGEVYEPIIGVWAWEDFVEYRYIFNADGTGERGIPGVVAEYFLWGVSGTTLYIDVIGMLQEGVLFRNQRWTFSIFDGVLTLDSQQIFGARFSYVRQ